MVKKLWRLQVETLESEHGVFVVWNDWFKCDAPLGLYSFSRDHESSASRKRRWEAEAEVCKAQFWMGENRHGRGLNFCFKCHIGWKWALQGEKEIQFRPWYKQKRLAEVTAFSFKRTHSYLIFSIAGKQTYRSWYPSTAWHAKQKRYPAFDNGFYPLPCIVPA